MGNIRSIKELAAECVKLNIEVKPSKIKADGTPRLMKEDYVGALRGYHLARKYPGGVPWHLELAIKIGEPMLCARYQELPPEEQSAIWGDPGWTVEEKYDGVRMLLFWSAKDPNRLHLYSRNISVGDFAPISYDNVLYRLDGQRLIDAGFEDLVLDGELLSSNPNVSTIFKSRGVVTETQLQAVTALLQLGRDESLEIQAREAPLHWRVFDVLRVNETWVTEKFLRHRLVALEKVLVAAQAGGLAVYPSEGVNTGKKAFYDAVIARNGEGVIAKNLDSHYKAGDRDRHGWVKVKRSMKESLLNLVGDTLDGWISGYDRGTEGKRNEDLVGTVRVSIFVREPTGKLVEHEIAEISGLSDEIRKDMTVMIDDGGERRPVLNPSYKGRVVEIDGQCISGRNKKLRHARLLRFRDDKYKDGCVIDRALLERMVL